MTIVQNWDELLEQRKSSVNRQKGVSIYLKGNHLDHFASLAK